MEILNIVLIVLLVIIPLIFIGLAVLWGFKRNIYQSLAKLGATVFAVLLSTLVAKLITPLVVSPIFVLFGQVTNTLGAGLIASASDIFAALIMPIVFVAILAVISLICLILYRTIIKKKLVDSKITEMKAKKAAAKTATIDESAEQIITADEQHNETKVENLKAKQAWLRVGCVALSILSVLLVLSHFAMPISYYSKIADDTLSVAVIEKSVDGELQSAVKMISNYPTVQCYRILSAPASWFFDLVSTDDGTIGSAQNTINSLLTILDSFTQLETNPQKEDLYEIADLLRDNRYLDNLILKTVNELVDAWSRGESVLGMSPDTLKGTISLDVMKSCIREVDSAYKLFYMLGDLITLPTIIEDGVTQEALSEVFIKFQPESITLVEAIVLENVKSLNTSSINISENLITGIFSAVLTIRNDESIAASEREAILTKEAESLDIFLSIMEEPKKADPAQVGKALSQSKALSDALFAATEGGTVSDPCGFGKALSSSFIKKVKLALENEGVSKDSDLYKSVNAFFSK